MTTRATGEAIEMSRVEEAGLGPVAPSPFQPTVPVTPAGIQMRGYLKKKRNRVGGWRKLYVVLQSQLLLSYASRRDYERRLAPFEDIVNLVPGTRILPSAGLRFTIETTSRNFYTFRCVDHRNCSEWITALLDSLQQGGCSRVGAGTARDRHFGQPSPGHRTSSPVWASVSMELGLARRLSCKTLDGAPSVRGGGSGLCTIPIPREEQQQQNPFQRHLPIVSSVAIPALKATPQTTGRHVKEVPVAEMKRDERGQFVEHSDEAFADEIITKAFQFLTGPKRSRDMTASEILEYYLERRQRLQLADQLQPHPHPPPQQQQEQAKEHEKGEQSAVRRMPGADTHQTSGDVRACAGVDEPTTGTSGRQPLATEDANEQQQQKAMDVQAPVRFRDFRLHPDVDRPIVAGRSQSVDVSRINSMFGEQQQQQQREELRRVRASPIVSRPVAPNLRETGQRVSSSCSDLPPVMQQLAASTFVASISGPVGPGATYTRRPSMGHDASGYEYITSHSSSSSSSSSSSVSTLASSRRIELTEPIYAVVDVKAKRFRRNQQQHQQNLPQDPGPHHHHYEEALPVTANRPVSEGAKEDDLMYDQQHIYEPIMIPAQPQRSATATATTTVCDREHRWRKLWRNLKRIRLHPGRYRRQKEHEQPSTVAEQPSTDSPATSSTSSSTTTTTTSNSSSGHQRAGLIAGLGSRLDSHRQSMKKRAKSLYDATSNAA